jgi:hypothetical protein
MDTHKTYINCLTSGYPQAAMSPLPFPTDQAALDAALPILGLAEPPDVKLLWIHNTLELAEVECGAAYLPLARERSDLEILTEPRPLPLGTNGMLPDSVLSWS